MRIRPIHVTLASLLLAACGDDGGANGNNDNLNNTNAQVLCGDGVTEGSEECDDGPQNSDTEPNACRTDCVLAYCGDGVQDDTEECDDGPQNSDEVPDGCRVGCLAPSCGDGVVDVVHGEGCDCGDGSGELPGRCVMPNSTVEGASCRPGCVPAGCGDGLLQGRELCDGTNLGNGSCGDYGFYQGEVACTDACSYDLSGCYEECGDGQVNGLELCDATRPDGEDCVTYGYDAGRLECTDYCTPDFAGCRMIGWKVVPVGIGFSSRRIWTADDGQIFVAGFNGQVLHYDGSAWAVTDTGAGAGMNLNGIWGSSSADVFAVGSQGNLARWNGSAWSLMTVPGVTGQLEAVWGRGSGDVYAVGFRNGGGGVVLHYDGTAWSEEYTSTFVPKAVWVGTGPDVFAVGGTPGNGLVARWDGTSWGESSTASGPLEAVWGISGSNVFASGDESLYHFDGANWTPMLYPRNPPDCVFWGLAGRMGDDVYVSGYCTAPTPEHLTMHWDGTSWTPVVVPVGTAMFSLSSGGAGGTFGVSGNGTIAQNEGHGDWALPHGVATGQMAGVWGSAADDIYVVSAAGDGEVAHYDGHTWSVSYPASIALNGVWGSSANNVYIVGGEDTEAVMLQKGVLNWVDITPFAADEYLLMGIWGTSASNIYAVGGWYAGGGRMLRYSGTTLWSDEPLPPNTPTLMDVWGTAPNEFFVVGDHGTILRGSGGVFTTMSSPTTSLLYGVWGASTSDVFAVGEHGTILHYNGTSWTAMQSSTFLTLQDVWGRSATDVYAVGEFGLVLHYDGVAWSRIRTSSSVHYRGVWGHNRSVFFAGDGGTIQQLILPTGSLF